MKVNRIRVSTGGIRHALIQRMIRRSPRADKLSSIQNRMDSIEIFGRSLHFDEKHAAYVRKLALSIYEQMAKPLNLNPESRDLLEAASLLHDVGHVVSYKGHHKHSYHLIAHSALEGFTPSEIEIIAQVARYHRKARPKKKHSPFAALSKDDQQTVMELASILRIADGLERRHSQGVKKVSCQVSNQKVQFGLAGSRSLNVEIYGAVEKSDLFEKVFGRKAVFEQIAQSERPAGNLRLVKNK